MAEHFDNTVNSLFKGMENFVTTKTVVGEAITVGDTVILPLVDVTFGIMASTKNEEKKSMGGGGMGGKMSPSALLVIKDGATRLVNIKQQDSVSKLIDMAPDLVNRFMPGGSAKTKNRNTPEEKKAMNEAAEDTQTF